MIQLTRGAAARDTLGYVQQMNAQAAVKRAAEARKREVETDKIKALDSPRLKASESAKTQARARVQQIAERLKILKKLYAMNPKEMARALAQVFKELKGALKQYKEAMGDELKLSGDVVSGALATAPETASKPEEPEAGEAGAEEDKTADNAAAREGASLYDSVVGEVRKTLGEDGLDFLKQLRSLVNGISDILEASRKQTLIRKRDKDTEEAFKDADEEMKALRDDLQSMAQDIGREIPAAGMRLSVAA